MKAIILAAGQGTRIREVHGARPKCLIPFDDTGWTILDQQIDALFAAGARDIGIVVGYEKEQIIRHVTRNYPASLHRFRFIENPAFAETNNIYSLWMARTWLKGSSFAILNADVVLDPQIRLIDRVPHNEEHAIAGERLLQEIEGADPGGLEGGHGRLALVVHRLGFAAQRDIGNVAAAALEAEGQCVGKGDRRHRAHLSRQACHET